MSTRLAAGTNTARRTNPQYVFIAGGRRAKARSPCKIPRVKASRLVRFVAGALVVSIFSGCVQRRLTVTSEPTGATVTLNDVEVGRTPLTTDIRWYGNEDVIVRKDGYETLKTNANITAPWWQYPPIDFLAELVPWGLTDHQAVSFKLEPKDPNIDRDALVARGLEMKTRLPATQPNR